MNLTMSARLLKLNEAMRVKNKNGMQAVLGLMIRHFLFVDVLWHLCVKYNFLMPSLDLETF